MLEHITSALPAPAAALMSGVGSFVQNAKVSTNATWQGVENSVADAAAGLRTLGAGLDVAQGLKRGVGRFATAAAVTMPTVAWAGEGEDSGAWKILAVFMVGCALMIAASRLGRR